MEENLTTLTGAFNKGQPAYAAIYKELANPLRKERVLTQENSFIGVTEHAISNTKKVVVLINYSPQDITTATTTLSGWKLAGSLYGGRPVGSTYAVKANDALVLTFRKN